jgi:hypothetical protein
LDLSLLPKSTVLAEGVFPDTSVADLPESSGGEDELLPNISTMIYILYK